jgi:hypothetical protein
MEWIKIATALNSHPKIQEFKPAERWVLVSLWMAAGRHNRHTGDATGFFEESMLVTESGHVGVRNGRLVVRQAMAKMLKWGFVIHEGCTKETCSPHDGNTCGAPYTLHDFAEMQSFGPKDPTAAERKRRQRQKKSDKGGGDPAPNDRDSHAGHDRDVTRDSRARAEREREKRKKERTESVTSRDTTRAADPEPDLTAAQLSSVSSFCLEVISLFRAAGKPPPSDKAFEAWTATAKVQASMGANLESAADDLRWALQTSHQWRNGGSWSEKLTDMQAVFRLLPSIHRQRREYEAQRGDDSTEPTERGNYVKWGQHGGN